MNHKSTATEIKDKRRESLLNKKYEDKTYFEKFKVLYQASIGSSWMFNLISGIGASALVFFFFSSIIPYLFIAVVFAAVFVVLWELAKRYLIINLFEDWYMHNVWNTGQMCILIVLIGGSVAATFFGAKELIPKILPEAELISFSEQSILLTAELSKMEAELEDLKNNKKYRTSKGEIMYKIKAFTIPEKTGLKDQMSAKLIALQEKIVEENGVIETDYKAVTELKSWHYSLFAAISDLLLLFCLWYKEKYEFIEYNERGGKKKAATLRSGATLPATSQNLITKERNVPSATYPIIRRNAESATPATPVITDVAPLQRETNATLQTKRCEEEAQRLKEMDVDDLLLLISKRKNSLRAYESKIRNHRGKVETNKKGLARCQSSIALIKSELERRGKAVKKVINT